MRRLLVLCAMATVAVACEPRREDLTVHWTFDHGLTCADVGVATIQVDVDGQRLTPNQFACANGSRLNGGAYLGAFLTGSYHVTVSGLDQFDGLLYQSDSTIRVERGGTDVSVDLARAFSTVTLRWTFAGRTCAAAGVSIVHLNVDGQALTDLNNNPDIPCTQSGFDGASIEPLSSGAHSFGIAGLTSSGAVVYAIDGVQITAPFGAETSATVDVPPASPTAATAFLTFDFDGTSCFSAGVDHIYVVFDPAADGSGGTPAGDFACIGVDQKPVTSTFIDNVPGGMHSFAIQGSNRGRLAYYTHRPQRTLFQIGLETDLYVPAEHLP